MTADAVVFVIAQKEEKGVMTVRFKDELAAEACIAVSICVAAFTSRDLTILAHSRTKRFPLAENERAVLCRADRFRLPDDG